MGLLRYQFRSETLSLSVNVTVTYPSERLSPEGREGDGGFGKLFPCRPGMKFQTVYLLHGGSDNDSLPVRFTNLERYASENCVITVCAQANDSFYVDTAYGFRYFTFFTEELPCVVRTLFASSPAREDNFLLGFAMGGNGALSLALRRPDLYAAAVDLSGGIGCMVDEEAFRRQMKEIPMVRLCHAFGSLEDYANQESNLTRWAEKGREHPERMPKLFLAVGEQDFIRDSVRRDRAALLRNGYPIHYEEAPGLGHEWEFWDRYFCKALREWLPLKRQPIWTADGSR